MNIKRCYDTELVCQIRLCGRRKQQIVTPHNLIHTLKTIVHNNRQVVRPIPRLRLIHTPTTLQNHIIHRAGVFPVEEILNRPLTRVGTQANCGEAALVGEVASS